MGSVHEICILLALMLATTSCDKESNHDAASNSATNSTSGGDTVAPADCGSDTPQCRAWAEAFCNVDLQSCAGRAAPVEGLDVNVNCVPSQVWLGAQGSACEDGAQSERCLATLFLGEGSPVGPPYFREVDGDVEVISFDGVQRPLGFESCDLQDPAPAACMCL
jgi:hypothetical protein